MSLICFPNCCVARWSGVKGPTGNKKNRAPNGLKACAAMANQLQQVFEGMPENGLFDRVRDPVRMGTVRTGQAVHEDVCGECLEVTENLAKLSAGITYDFAGTADGTQSTSKVWNGLFPIQKFDAALILTDHTVFDYPSIINTAQMVFDTRNACGIIQFEKIIQAWT